MPPKIRHIAALWTLTDHPNRRRPWSLERKVAAVKEAGFDGFATAATPEHRVLAEKHGLRIVGYFASARIRDFGPLLRAQRDAGAFQINVQMGRHDTTTADALKMALALFKEAEKLGVRPSIEVHRDMCTETPEKTYALADAYRRETGCLLPLTWDFSHLAVVKHLHPGNYAARLLTHPDLIQHAEQFHCRPFNGHHAQVPVTDGRGRLTEEFQQYLPFLDDLLGLWLKGAQEDRELLVVPELGPVNGGYGISTWPSPWEDAKRLRGIIARRWKALSR